MYCMIWRCLCIWEKTRDKPRFRKAVMELLICSEEMRNILTSLSIDQGVRRIYENLATSGQTEGISMDCLFLYSFFSTPFLFRLRSISGVCLISKGLMRLRMLRWMLKSERNISISLSLSQKILNTRGSIQGMMECLAGSSMFTVGKQRSVWIVGYSHPLGKHQLSY